MSFKKTHFVFKTDEAESLHISYVMTYGLNKEWVELHEGGCTHQSSYSNPGIKNLKIIDSVISMNKNGYLTVDIDPEVVNNVPYASDGASLLLSVNGSNLHINIHSGGGLKNTGTYGNESVKFDTDLKNVGETSIITCRKS